MRRAALVAMVATGALALPATAGAATVSIEGGFTVRVLAAAGEANVVTVARGSGNYVVTDTGVAPTAGPGCAPSGAVVICPDTGIFAINVDLGDLADTSTFDPSIKGGFELNARMSGGSGADTLNGSPNAHNDLSGGEGDDTLNGSDSFDRLGGGDGNDLMNGGGERDSFDASDGNDVANGGPGEDDFGSFNRPDGADTFDGGPDDDSLRMSQRVRPLSISPNGVADDGEGCPGAGCEGDNVLANVEGFSGGEGDDFIAGGPEDNDFDGNRGNDTIGGAGGKDNISGGEGDDVLRGDAGDDEIDGGEGADQHLAGPGDDELFDNFIPDPGDVFSGGKGIDLAFMFGTTAQRVDLDGRADDGSTCPGAACEGDNVQADVEDLEGGDGRDVFIGSKAANDLVGGIGPDKLVGLGGPDGLHGEDGDDSLQGGKGRDLIEGDAGADRIGSRDGGPDQVSCGASADRVKGDRADSIGADCDKVDRGKRR